MTITINGSGPITGSDRAELGTNDDITSLGAVTSINGGQLAGLRNKIINGGMGISQRGTSFPAIVTVAYSLDRWNIVNPTAAVGTVTQQADAPSDNLFQSSYRYTVTTADTTIAAAEQVNIRQFIEGYNIRDLIGRTFTLSFRVRSSKTGIHCVAFRNIGADRSYIMEYTVNVANTWETKSLTVSGGLITAGTWNWTSDSGLLVGWPLAVGTNFHTTAGAWQTGNFWATTNQVNCLDTIGNIFAITGVQLEVGSVATPFEQRPYGMELTLCQRYFRRVNFLQGVNSFGSTTAAVLGLSLMPEMRTTPASITPDGVISVTDSNTGFTQSAAAITVVGGTATKQGAFLSLPNFTGFTAGRQLFMYASNDILVAAEL